MFSNHRYVVIHNGIKWVFKSFIDFIEQTKNTELESMYYAAGGE